MVPESQVEKEEQRFGPWMLVQRRRRFPEQPKFPQGKEGAKKFKERESRPNSWVLKDPGMVRKSGNIKAVWMEKETDRSKSLVNQKEKESAYVSKSASKEGFMSDAKKAGKAVLNLADHLPDFSKVGFSFQGVNNCNGLNIGSSSKKGGNKGAKNTVSTTKIGGKSPIPFVNGNQQKGRIVVLKEPLNSNSAVERTPNDALVGETEIEKKVSAEPDGQPSEQINEESEEEVDCSMQVEDGVDHQNINTPSL